MGKRVTIETFYRPDTNLKIQLINKYLSVDPAAKTCEDFSAVLRSSGVVSVMGKMEFSPEDEQKWRFVRKLCHGRNHILGLRTDGTVVAFGDNTFGQCQVADWRNIVDISAEDDYSVGITAEQQQYITGRFGEEKGESTVAKTGEKPIEDITPPPSSPQTTPTAGSTGRGVPSPALRQQYAKYVSGHDAGASLSVTTLAPIPQRQLSIAASQSGVYILREDGHIDFSDESPALFDFGTWQNVVQMAAGDHFLMGLTSDGSVLQVQMQPGAGGDVSRWNRDMAWLAAAGSYVIGLKTSGQLLYAGSGSAVTREEVEGIGGVIAVAAGPTHFLAIRQDHTVISLGDDYFHQCGDVASWTHIKAVAAGNYFSIGLREDGTVAAVGDNKFDQCDVDDWTDIVAVSARNEHTVGLRSDGRVLATGNNEHGQCNVSHWRNVAAVMAGDHCTVGVQRDGTVLFAGKNTFGSLQQLVPALAKSSPQIPSDDLRSRYAGIFGKSYRSPSAGAPASPASAPTAPPPAAAPAKKTSPEIPTAEQRSRYAGIFGKGASAPETPPAPAPAPSSPEIPTAEQRSRYAGIFGKGASAPETPPAPAPSSPGIPTAEQRSRYAGIFGKGSSSSSAPSSAPPSASSAGQTGRPPEGFFSRIFGKPSQPADPEPPASPAPAPAPTKKKYAIPPIPENPYAKRKKKP